MDRLKGRVAVVCGASAGIGADVVKQLAIQGIVVVGLARRKEQVEKLDKEVGDKGKIHAVKCSVTDEKEVADAFEWIDKNLGAISVLINNAGMMHPVTFSGDADPVRWKEMLDTNVYGMSLCIRHGLKNMLKHKIDDGNIININSIAGHNMPSPERIQSTMYIASKHAVTVLTDGLRKELVQLKSKIRVSSLSPGLVKTEFFDSNEDKIYKASAIYAARPFLMPEHITSGIIYILSAPPIVNISELTIKPTGESM